MEEFDVEKYRKENPMDYLKVMDILNEHHDNPFIFEIMFKITRLHIPKLLYKYYSLADNDPFNEVKFSTLLDKKIYISDLESFNDPFDGRAFFYRSEELLKYESLKSWNGKPIDDFASYVRLASFTKVGINNMPMWAHYSNNHRGYCVEYDTTLQENLYLKASMFPVQYVDKRIDITPIMDTIMSELERLKEKALREGTKRIHLDNMILPLIGIFYNCIKHPSWSYEEEIRYITSSTNDYYVNAIPSAIYIGEKCNNVNKSRLLDIANELRIPAYQMGLSKYSLEYEFEPKLIS
ncbi:DUF2971 domain-containing protein [Paenibacillus sp. Dod16]|uniref:DUF2971 domain-containing protein n=1 Tax=Paenibacillus sp. Dod16 TaxID=3416392 RepID=UPI003CF8B4DA